MDTDMASVALTAEEVIFLGEKSTPETVAEMKKAGLFHGTGISVVRSTFKGGYTIGMIDVTRGTWGENGQTAVIITSGGEFWFKLRTDDDDQEARRQFLELAKKHAPKGNGAWVPLSNGEFINATALLERLEDTYSGMTCEEVS